MKKKLIITVITLTVISGALIYLSLTRKDSLLGDKIRPNSPEIERRVKILQSEMSAFVFVTQESESEHILNINLTPFLTFNLEEEKIKSFELINFKGINAKSEVILIAPTDLSVDTLSRTFLFTEQTSITQEDINSQADTVEYVVVQEVKKFNEISNSGSVSPYFGLIIKDIGRVNYKEIFERDDFFDGGRYLEYSKIPLESLDTEITFDIKIQFEDGEWYMKRFKAQLKGSEFANENSVMISIEVVE